MKLSYFSLAAFLAHYLALRSARGASAGEQRLLAEMDKMVGALMPAERAALESDTPGPLRRRAELDLRRRLEAAGALEG